MEESLSVYGRHIDLSNLREKILRKHEKIGIIRDNDNLYYSKLPLTNVYYKLRQYGEDAEGEETQARDQLKQICRTRHLKIWHDHSEVAGHGHLLVLVSAIYDPALFYSNAEKAQKGVTIDVHKTVQEPHTYILARSKSSLKEQASFNHYRTNDLNSLGTELYTLKQTPIQDRLRYFHGDGPAQQFEAGAKIGGKYACVGCTATSSMLDDLTYTYHCNHMSIADRQAFTTAGVAWRKGGVNPLDNLKIKELKAELAKRGENTADKKKTELEQIFSDLRAGINNVPALLQKDPTAVFT